MSLRRSRNLSLLVAVLGITGACVSPKDPGVTVDAVQADIVFGVELPEVGDVTAPTATPGSVGAAPVASASLRVPFRNILPGRFSNVDFTVQPGQVDADCPKAPVTEAPDVIAPDNASAPPAAGLYRWKRNGTQTAVVQGQAYESPITGLEPRLVRNIDRISETRWTFEVVQPYAGGAVLATTYGVNTDPVEYRSPTSGGRGVAAPYVGNTTRAGEPGRGLTIERQQTFDGNGAQVGEFDPSSPILLTPLPVTSGDSWTSVGVDAKSGQTMRVEGVMARREAVDACGSRLDAWLADLTVTLSGAEQVTRQLDLFVSTELGAMPIGERIDESSASGTLKAFYEIGQRDPTPPPADGTAS